MGEVAEIRIDGGASRFDPNVGRDHHHLVCRSCGLIFDVTPKGVEGLRLTPSQRYGFTVDDVEVVFRGRCSQCAERSG